MSNLVVMIACEIRIFYRLCLLRCCNVIFVTVATVRGNSQMLALLWVTMVTCYTRLKVLGSEVDQPEHGRK